MEPKSPSKLKLSVSELGQYRRVFRILGFAFLIVLLICVSYAVYSHIKTRSFIENQYYTVVVDCGSSGTRISVYEWKSRHVREHELPVLMHSYPDDSHMTQLSKVSCRYHCMQTEPGLDKFLGNASGIRTALEPLIFLAETWVPSKNHGKTPIFVLATAGLRNLAADESEWVMDEVLAVVSNHAFKYSRDWIRVLSGKEEAYYGWVALNYKMGKLSNSLDLSASGLLDLGGSSLQVVVEVDDSRDAEKLIRSKIGSIEHKLLPYSLSAFGLNEAFDRTVVLLNQMHVLNQNPGDRTKIRHPCLSSGFAQNFTCYGCIGHRISRLENYSSEIWNTELYETYLVGDPNWEQCKGIARAAAMNLSVTDWLQVAVGSSSNGSLSSLNSSSILNLTAIAQPTEHFHALSAFNAVINTLNLSSKANSKEIWRKGEDICLESWNNNSISQNQKYATQYCFRVPYMASLIEDTLGLGDKEIIFGPQDLSWTLGAALVEGDYLWVSGSYNSLTLTKLKTVSSPLFVFVFLAFLLFLVYWSRIKLPMPAKKSRNVVGSLPSYVNMKRRPK